MNPVYMWRSDPQIAVLVIRRIASFCEGKIALLFHGI
jgi:hypothetical protein